MGIFDIFSFKRESEKVFTKENFEGILKTARDAIVSEVKSNIPGPEKKIVADAIVSSKLDDLKMSTNNSVVVWILGLIELSIPSITQLIYDFLKEKIENL